MKRIRFGEQGEFTDSINLANVLMLLAAGGTKDQNSTPSSPPRVFECKTCSRQFPSFQALGGHRASHKKPTHEDGPGQLTLGKPKMHKCSICGLGFAIGQALGGHMRRHRANSEGFGRHDMAEKKSWGEKRVLSLDLNFPPLDETEERLKKMGLGLRLDMVDCFH